MKNIGNLFVRLSVSSLLTFRYFSTIVSLFGAGAGPRFFSAPVPAPSKPFRRLRLRFRPKRVGSGSLVSIGCPRIIRTCIFPQLSLLRWNRWKCGCQKFMKSHQKAKRNATHFRSPLMTPFSHYCRFALRNCFSLFVQVPNRQLLTRDTTLDSTTERLTSNLLESL